MKGVEASRNAIAGAILQLAFMGLKIHSKNTTVPGEWQNEYESLSKVQRKQLKLFAVGRKIWSNTPLGLAIYAGRNQYNHFDDHSEGYNLLVETILHRMGDFNRTELSFDVLPFYRYPQSIASHMIDIIGWKMYEQYSSDIKEAVA